MSSKFDLHGSILSFYIDLWSGFMVNLIFTELLPNKCLAGTWNSFWFCVKYELTLQVQVKSKTIFQNSFQVDVGKIFQSKCIWPHSENITASSNWKPFMCLLWFDFFSVLEIMQSCCLIKASWSSKYCLAKNISITSQSKWH